MFTIIIIIIRPGVVVEFLIGFEELYVHGSWPSVSHVLLQVKSQPMSPNLKRRFHCMAVDSIEESLHPGHCHQFRKPYAQPRPVIIELAANQAM